MCLSTGGMPGITPRCGAVRTPEFNVASHARKVAAHLSGNYMNAELEVSMPRFTNIDTSPDRQTYVSK